MGYMTNLVEAEGPILDRILDDTYEIWHDGLTQACLRPVLRGSGGDHLGPARTCSGSR